MTLRNLSFSLMILLAACGGKDGGISPTPGGAGGGAGAAGGNAGGGGAQGGGQGGGGPGGAAGFFNVPDAGQGRDGTTGGGNTGDANCGLTTVNLQAKPPEIMLVFDRSSSMNELVPTTMTSRYTEAMAAITDVLNKTNATVLWGLKMYPAGMRCGILPGVDVPVGMSTGPMVAMSLMAAPPGMPTGTPTHLALNAATEHLKTRTTTNPKYILLTTDGQPNCADGGNGDGEMVSLAAIQAAAGAGFHTFVVGIATAGTTADATLNNFAMAGGEPRMGVTKYYPATVRDELVSVLTQITGQVTNCVYPLSMQPPSPNDVAVNVGSMRIARDPMNGWDYGMGMQSVVLHGKACELAKSGMAGSVQIIFGCPNQPIP